MEKLRTPRQKPDIGGIMFTIGAFCLVLGGARGCAQIAEEPQDKVIDFVEDSGYRDVVVTDTDHAPFMWGCGKGDLVKYEVEATSANTGRSVDIIVCDGMLKGMTIRS